MTLTRRHFLSFTAAAAAAPCMASAYTSDSWHGRALGADVALTLEGPREVTRPALNAARALLAEVETTFSLSDPSSSLSRLNRDKLLTAPNRHMRAVIAAADDAYRATGGLFDPSVQSILEARDMGRAPESSGTLGAWDAVQVSDTHIQLNAAHVLTFDGIVKGYAIDALADLVNRYELAPVHLAVGAHKAVGQINGIRVAMAGLSLNASSQSKILHRSARPQWSSVSVEATNARVADALSTALILAPLDRVRSIRDLSPSIHRIALTNAAGKTYVV